MPPSRFDVPLHYVPLVGKDPKKWINKIMSTKKRKWSRKVPPKQFPNYFREVIRDNLIPSDEEVISKDCVFTHEDILLPDPKKVAKCLISKPTLEHMGEDEEKVYCGMIFGPEPDIYKHKAKKRVGKTIKKFFIKKIVEVDKTLKNMLTNYKKKLKFEYKEHLNKGINFYIEEMEAAIKEKQKQLSSTIEIAKQNLFQEEKGRLYKEMKCVSLHKTLYLKEAFKFQIKSILKNNERQYLNRINIYSNIWKKVFYKLKKKAKIKILELHYNAHQVADEASIEALVNKIQAENLKIVLEFEEEVETTINRLKAKTVSEEFRIKYELKKRELIETKLDLWRSLLGDIIELFDKIAVAVFKGEPGLCNFFLTKEIIAKSEKLFYEVKEFSNQNISVENTRDEIETMEQSEEENSTKLSDDKSYVAIDMSLKRPEQDLIIELNLFQINKLIEETRCAFITKPLQISEFMEDRTVELMSFDELSEEHSSNIINKLLDANHIVKKMLLQSQRDVTITNKQEKVAYRIEEDPEITKRVKSLINVYRTNPDLIKGLTNI